MIKDLISKDTPKVRLEEIVELKRGEGFGKKDLLPKGEVGKHRALIPGELFKAPHIIEAKRHISTRPPVLGKPGMVLMPADDVTPDGLATASVLNDSDVYLGSGMFVMTPREDVNSSFLAYAIKAERKAILSKVVGTTVKHLYAKHLLKIEVFLPPLEDQIRIANFLDQFSEAIKLQEESLDLLKLEKQILLQKIFADRNFSFYLNGRLFDTGQWSPLSIWQCYKFEKRYQGVDKSKQKYITGFTIDSMSNFIERLSSETGSIHLLSCSPDVLFTDRSKALPGTVHAGEVVALPRSGSAHIKYVSGEFVSADNRLASSIDGMKYSVKFLYYTLLAKKRIVELMYRGAAVKHIHMPSLLDYKIKIPSLQDQQLIADYFSQLDERIRLETERRELLKLEQKVVLSKIFAT